MAITFSGSNLLGEGKFLFLWALDCLPVNDAVSSSLLVKNTAASSPTYLETVFQLQLSKACRLYNLPHTRTYSDLYVNQIIYTHKN